MFDQVPGGRSKIVPEIMYEVEMKFRIDDPGALERRLTELGVVFETEVEEIDRFYQHPSRDFVRTDEALRIRRRIAPGESERKFLTYKGPKVDSETKTRREIEVPLENAESWDEILLALGFSPRGSVDKFRRHGVLSFRNRSFSVLLDRLPALEGRPSGFLFVELETLAEEDEMPEARRDLIDLAASLNLSDSVRKSYLGLLHENATP